MGRQQKSGFPSDVLQQVIDQLGTHVMVTDIRGKILYVNPAFEDATGYGLNEILGLRPVFLESENYSISQFKKMWKAVKSGKPFVHTIRNRKKSSEEYHAQQIISPIKDENGEIQFIVLIWEEITALIEKESHIKDLYSKLEYEKNKLEQILDFDEKVSGIKDLHKLADFVVRQTCRILESERCSLMLIDKDMKALCIKAALGVSDHHIVQSRLQVGEGVSGYVAKHRQPLLVKDVEEHPVTHRKNRDGYTGKSFMCVPILLGDKIIGVLNISEKSNDGIYTDLDLKVFCSIAREVAVSIENAKLYRNLKFWVVTDPLTELHNHRFFMDTMKYEISRVQRTNMPLTLALIDIDNFKEYNDRHGHVEGDHLLKLLAETIRDHIRVTDIPCRYAGDEFAIILPATDMNGAGFVAQKMIEQILKVSLEKAYSVSVGVGTYVDGMDIYDLIRKAEVALYQAKSQGKGSYFVC